MVGYPVSVAAAPQIADRDRLTTAFRILLALPHIILVGGAGSTALSIGSGSEISAGGNAGILGAIASVLAIVSWFTIVFSGRHVEGIREFTRFVLRWRARSIAYSMLLVDTYPPFGDGEYPVTVRIMEPAGPRDRLSVGLRLLLVVPHIIVLFFLVCGWWVASVFAWAAILITKRYPQGLAAYSVGTLRWMVRVDAYLMLLVDDYPPFGFA